VYVTSGKNWDTHRNSSATHKPHPGALGEALAALRALRRDDLRLVAWIEDGYPTLTEAEHVAHFGVPYTRKPRRAPDA
jgi:hypothetical protein